MPVRGRVEPKGAGGAPTTDPRATVRTWLIGIAVALAIAWTLRQTVWITLPLAVAFFIALGVWPVCRWVQERVPRRLGFLGHAAAMAVIVLLLSLFFAAIWYAAHRIVTEFPRYADDFHRLWEQASALADGWGLPVTLPGAREGGEPAPANGGQPASDPVTGFALGIVNSAWRTLTNLVLIFFFVLLMLIEAPTWRAKLGGAFGPEREGAWLDSIAASAQRFRLYLILRTVIGIVTGALYWLWLTLWGVEFALLWGVLAYLLNYIPNFGSFVVFALASLFTFMQQGVETGLIVAVGLLVFEQAMGNVIEPRVQGQRLSISPLVVLVSLLVWGWIWGITGTLLAVPLTVLMIIAFAHIRALRPLALLLSDADSMKGLGEATRPD